MGLTRNHQDPKKRRKKRESRQKKRRAPVHVSETQIPPRTGRLAAKENSPTNRGAARVHGKKEQRNERTKGKPGAAPPPLGSGSALRLGGRARLTARGKAKKIRKNNHESPPMKHPRKKRQQNPIRNQKAKRELVGKKKNHLET